jgi:hypothetical protein
MLWLPYCISSVSAAEQWVTVVVDMLPSLMLCICILYVCLQVRNVDDADGLVSSLSFGDTGSMFFR